MVGVSRLGVATAIHPGKAVIIVSDVMNSELSDEAQVIGEGRNALHACVHIQ